MRNWYYSKINNGLRALISHEKESFRYIQSAILIHEPQVIIELGSAYYGLTLLMHEVNTKTPIYSFDYMSPKQMIRRSQGYIKNSEALDILKEKGFNSNVYFIVTDLLLGEGDPTVLKLVSSKRRKFLYLDNGNKIKEMSLYAKHLRNGDLLGVHDWGREISNLDRSVRKILSSFYPHPFNWFFERSGVMTRMFIKA